MSSAPNGRIPELDGIRGIAIAMVIAHQKVLKAMSAPTGKTASAPSAAWPTDTYPGESKEIYSNSEGIELFHHRRREVREAGCAFADEMRAVRCQAAGFLAATVADR